MSYTGSEIAIIGMSTRLPGAKNINEFWDNLLKGKETISFFNDKELKEYGIENELLNNPNYIKAKGVLDDIEFFDSDFFGYSSGMATIMDPQQRFFHEVAWEALEDSGYSPEKFDGLIGVFAGATNNFNWILSNLTGINSPSQIMEIANLNNRDYLCSNLSYKLNLNGPSCTIQTACSTSLVAVHLACQSLLGGDCDMALAGGVSISLPKKHGYLHERNMITSEDGHCKAFDKDANGTVMGDGIGMVVLKRLNDAIKDNDNIYAIIKGSAINNDGNKKIGFTAPSVNGQYEVINAAYQISGVEIENIFYIEAHGTGTNVGDPIEIEALKRAFKTNKKNYCGIGSVKSNIGHLNTAAGIVGLIKTSLILKNRYVPKTINFKQANDKLNIEDSPFYIADKNIDLSDRPFPLNCAVSSFGIGGTNSHFVLEQAPFMENESVLFENNCFIFSAKTLSALQNNVNNLKDYLLVNPNVNLTSVAYTLQTCKQYFQYKTYLVGKDINDTLSKLSDKLPNNETNKNKRPIVFMFPGQGAQYVNMGKQLLGKLPKFKEELEYCLQFLKNIEGIDYTNILFNDNEIELDIHQTKFTQPILFSFEYALAKQMLELGIQPDAMIGHSVGEYVAAVLSNVITLQDALKILAIRGKLIQQLPKNSMLSVSLSEQALKPLLKKNISIAAINSSSLCVVAGKIVDIENFEKELKSLGYNCSILNTSHAFHSYLMDPILDEFEQNLGFIQLGKPQIPFISNLTGNWVSSDESINLNYWKEHLRQPVKFSMGLTALFNLDEAVFLEIGPGNTLCTFVNNHIDKTEGHVAINLIRSSKDKVSDYYHLFDKFGQLFLLGISINWSKIYPERQIKKISLPTYAFDKIYFETNKQAAVKKLDQILERRDIKKWFYIPVWKNMVLANTYLPNLNKTISNNWLVFSNETPISSDVVKKLKEKHNVIVVKQDITFKKIQKGEYCIDTQKEADYIDLFNQLNNDNLSYENILFFGSNLLDKNNLKAGNKLINKAELLNLNSLLFLLKNLSKEGTINLYNVTNNVFNVTGNEEIIPENSLTLGLSFTIPQEFSSIKSCHIDIDTANPNNIILDNLLNIINCKELIRLIAIRNNRKYIIDFQELNLDVESGSSIIKNKGVYIITGGLGDVGFSLAKYLKRKYSAKLIIISRNILSQLNQGLDQQSNNFNQKSARMNLIKEWGEDVLLFESDVSDYNKMKEIIDFSENRFGQINGVIHAAGIVKGKTFSPIQELNIEAFEEQSNAKVYGTEVIKELFKNKKNDFCYLFSSISSFIGGIGFGAYASANQYLDATANKISKSNYHNWASINFDSWSFSNNIQDVKPQLGLALNGLSIRDEDTDELFNYLFSIGNTSQLIISTSDFKKRYEKIINSTSSKYINKRKSHESKYFSRPNLSNSFMAPKNDIEKLLQIIWQDFFKINPIGVQDDYFELGGDSLKAISIASKIRDEMNIDISISDFFDKPNIEAIAGYILKSNVIDIIGLNKASIKKYYSLSPAQKRFFISNQLNPDSKSYNTPSLFRLEGKIDIGNLESLILFLINRHESLRTSFDIIENEPVQIIHEHVNFKIDQYFPKNDAELKKFTNDFIKPFDLKVAPLIRIGLFKISDNTFDFLIDAAHIIFDIVSLQIFLEELLKLLSGENLPDVRFQYKDFSEWFNNSYTKEYIKEQEKYWLNIFNDDVPKTDFPTDYPRPSMRNIDLGDFILFSISEQNTLKIKSIVQETKSTMFIFLFTIYNILIYKYINCNNLIIGLPITGRSNSELEKIIGIFVNMLAHRSKPDNEKTFLSFMNEIKDTTLQAFNNQDYPFDLLVKKLNMKRDSSRNPLFDIEFSMDNVKLPTIEIKGLKITGMKSIIKFAKMDLHLLAKEEFNQITMNMRYSTELFKKSTIESFIKNYNLLIDQVLNDINIKLKDIHFNNSYNRSVTEFKYIENTDFIFE